MRRDTATPFGPCVTTVSTCSRVIWRVTDVCACATAAANAGAKAIKVKDAIVVLIARPPGQASCWVAPQRRTDGLGSGRAAPELLSCPGIDDRRRHCGRTTTGLRFAKRGALPKVNAGGVAMKYWPKHFQEKWNPVFRPKMQQCKSARAVSGSGLSNLCGTALGVVLAVGTAAVPVAAWAQGGPRQSPGLQQPQL